MAPRKKAARKGSRKARKGVAQGRWYDSNWFLLVLAVLVVVGVRVYHVRRGSEPVHEPEEATEQPAAVEVSTPATPPAAVAVEVTGAVAYQGMLHDRVVVPTVDRRSCLEHVAGALRVTDGHLADALVWIEGTGESTAGSARLQMRSSDCQIEPRAAVARRGAILAWDNADDVRHEIVAQDTQGSEVFALELSPGGEATHPVAATGVIQLSCSRHPWEHATVLVAEHELTAVTDVDGRFRFDSVRPPAAGETATLRVFHPLLGSYEQGLDLGSGQPVDLEIDLSERAL